MVRTFEITAGAKKAIDKAMARLDAKRARQRKAVTAKQLEVKRRRERERASAKREDAPRLLNQPNELRKRYALPGWQVLAARMEPGTWYTAGQVFDLMTEFPRGSVKAWLWQKALKAGVVERAGNPDWKPDPARPMQTGERYLYAVAASATGKAQEWRLALGMCSDASRHENSAC